MTFLITGEHSERGTLWAAFDPSVHHLTGRSAESRFSARLSPFRSREEAETALIAAGGVLEPVHG
jgi:hypothetical protein